MECANDAKSPQQRKPAIMELKCELNEPIWFLKAKSPYTNFFDKWSIVLTCSTSDVSICVIFRDPISVQIWSLTVLLICIILASVRHQKIVWVKIGINPFGKKSLSNDHLLVAVVEWIGQNRNRRYCRKPSRKRWADSWTLPVEYFAIFTKPQKKRKNKFFLKRKKKQNASFFSQEQSDGNRAQPNKHIPWRWGAVS